MKRTRGQVEIAHVLTGLATAIILGAGGFIWSLVRPEPKEDQARAVSAALQAREMAELRRITDEHTAVLKVVVPQLQRIEDAVTDIREQRGVRPASGKR